VSHGDESDHVQRSTGEHDLRRAEAVRDHSREGLHRTPHEVLHRHRERERLAPPMEVRAHRLQKEPEPVAHAHSQRQHEAAAHENDGRRAPVGARCCGRTGNGGLCGGRHDASPQVRCQRPRPPGSGCNASMSPSVAISA
jgi:hypothetical protein